MSELPTDIPGTKPHAAGESDDLVFWVGCLSVFRPYAIATIVCVAIFAVIKVLT